MATPLASFSTQDLLDELNQRLRCTSKEGVTRTILIGKGNCDDLLLPTIVWTGRCVRAHRAIEGGGE